MAKQVHAVSPTEDPHCFITRHYLSDHRTPKDIGGPNQPWAHVTFKLTNGDTVSRHVRLSAEMQGLPFGQLQIALHAEVVKQWESE